MNPIKGGDLVRVASTPGYCDCYVGRIFYVGEVIAHRDTDRIQNFWKCAKCGHKEHCEIFARAENTLDLYALPMLRRIPPLSELEGVDRDIKREAETT